MRDEHSALKLAYNAKVEEVKRTNVQLTKIENLLKMKDKMDGTSCPVPIFAFSPASLLDA